MNESYFNTDSFAAIERIELNITFLPFFITSIVLILLTHTATNLLHIATRSLF